MNAIDILTNGAKAVEEKREIFLKDNGIGYGKLIDAMNYSVSAGGCLAFRVLQALRRKTF